MWLLETNSQQLKYFQGSQVPARYAILSHRWQDEEVTFEDIYDARTSYTQKYGWSKVTKCCQLAQSDGFKYVWIDSCCIDKRSSAELSEAINSMYDWYGRATVCYTYLFDVHDTCTIEEFQKVSWFSRSWTLQELLAPAQMDFFNSAWIRIGSKSSMAGVISRITSIPKAALEHFDSSKYSIAQRMSWAAGREATRIEDIAYSLLGIFDINIPLLYGEGTKAFQRLQEAIMNVSNDLSLFVWEGKSCPKFGLLAASPAGFLRNHHAWSSGMELSRGYNFNNAGLFIDLEIRPLFLSADLAGVYAAYLHDPGNAFGGRGRIEIYLLKDTQRTHYRRISVDGRLWDLVHESKSSDENERPARVCQMLIRKDVVVGYSEPHSMGFTICGCPPGVYIHVKSSQAAGNFPTFQQPNVFTGWQAGKEGMGKDFHIRVPATRAYGIFGYLAWTRASENDFVIVCFGYDFDFQPLCLAFVFPGKCCVNPLMGLSSGILMARYLQILPESSISGCGTEAGSTMCAVRGEQRTNSRRELLGLNSIVRFLPTKSSLCRMFIDFGSVKVPNTPLPVRSDESMAKLRHMFGAPERPGMGTMIIERSMASVIHNDVNNVSVARF